MYVKNYLSALAVLQLIQNCVSTIVYKLNEYCSNGETTDFNTKRFRVELEDIAVNLAKARTCIEALQQSENDVAAEEIKITSIKDIESRYQKLLDDLEEMVKQQSQAKERLSNAYKQKAGLQ